MSPEINPSASPSFTIIIDEKIATPILLGSRTLIHQRIVDMGLDLDGIELINPSKSPKLDKYITDFYLARQRRGMTRFDAERLAKTHNVFGMMMVKDTQPVGVNAYVMVENIDGKLAQASAAGGRIVVPKTEIPGVGWFGFFSDPDGVIVGLFTPKTPPPPPVAATSGKRPARKAKKQRRAARKSRGKRR